MNAEGRADNSDRTDQPGSIQASPSESKRVQPVTPAAAVPKRPFAWQPLTPKGIAAFAEATVARVLTVQFVFALIAAGACIWFLNRDWYPVISAAIRQLPREGEIRSGRLTWYGDSPVSLAENRFFAIAVDLRHEGQARSPAHVAVEFGERDFKIYSLLGYMEGGYHRWWVGLNQADATPWWGAWAPPILGIVATVVIVSLLPCWAMLATLYAGPAWLVGFFLNRDLSLGGSWRLSGAALMPGCVFLAGTICIYGLGFLDLVRLGVAFAAHVMIGWFYVWLSIRELPVHPDAAAAQGNPFSPRTAALSEKKKDKL